MSEHLFLTGYRAVGKTAVASILADQLSCPMIDLDDRIVSAESRSVAEIFDDGGEALFRKIESEMLSEAIDEPPSVISLGGGTIVGQPNRQSIRESGFVVWLTALPQTIADRMATDIVSATQRPALTDQSAIDEVTQLLAKRQPWYEEVADICVATDQMSIDEVVKQIVALLPPDRFVLA